MNENKKKISVDKILLGIVALLFLTIFVLMTYLKIIGFINKKIVKSDKNNLPIEQVIENKIYEETGRTVDVEILSKEPLEVCTFYLDTCFKTEEVANAYEYKILIKDEEIPELKINSTYKDAYSDKEATVDCYDYTKYISYYKQKQNIKKILDSNENIQYKIYEDDIKIVHNVYIYTQEYESLKDTFSDINSLSRSDDYYHYYMYITNDIDIFNSIKLSEDESQKSSLISGHEKKLEFGFFRYDILDEFTQENPDKTYYLVYGSQGCSGLCTRVYEKD